MGVWVTGLKIILPVTDREGKVVGSSSALEVEAPLTSLVSATGPISTILLRDGR